MLFFLLDLPVKRVVFFNDGVGQVWMVKLRIAQCPGWKGGYRRDRRIYGHSEDLRGAHGHDDLLTRPKMELSEKEKDEVKKVAWDLLDTLTHEKLVLDWRKKQQARAQA